MPRSDLEWAKEGKKCYTSYPGWVLEQPGFESGFATSCVPEGFELPLPPLCMGLIDDITHVREEPSEERMSSWI